MSKIARQLPKSVLLALFVIAACDAQEPADDAAPAATSGGKADDASAALCGELDQAFDACGLSLDADACVADLATAEDLIDEDCEALEDTVDFASGRSYFHAFEVATIRKNTDGADIDTVTHLSSKCFSFHEPSSGEIFAPERTGLECIIQEVRADLEISRGIVEGTVQRRVVYSAQIVGGSPDTAKVITDWTSANPTPQLRDLGQHWNDNSDPYRSPAFSDYDGPLTLAAMFFPAAAPYIGGAMVALDLQHDWGREGWLLSESRRSGSDGDLDNVRRTGKTVFSSLPTVDPSYSSRQMKLTSG